MKRRHTISGEGRKNSLWLLIVLLTVACQKEETTAPMPPVPVKEEDDGNKEQFIAGVDISRLPEIELASPKPQFYNRSGKEEDLLDILKQNGVNTIRLRLWVNPKDNHSGFAEVKSFSQRLKAKGFKIWVTPHYSDTWADPAQQDIPAQWADLNLDELTAQVGQYTKQIVDEIAPEYLQIGNEINPGFLLPQGSIKAPERFNALANAAINAIREHAPNTKIIIHYAGMKGSSWFFNQVDGLSYDLMGISYYPFQHGTSLTALKDTLQTLSQRFNKDVVVAETAYPFTLKWNDHTNNLVGENKHLIPGFPASPEGQQNFVNHIKEMLLRDVERGIGFCYWGGELIAWKGSRATDGSPWENQALFDFENKALPVLEVFGK